MSGINEFLRICPSCGKRFHVKLVGEKLVGVDIGERTTETLGMAYRVGGIANSSQSTVEDDAYRYSYKCSGCGHEWSEKSNKTHEMGGSPSDYTGD
ncbi:MAG: hypothetical protein ABSB56_08680 [Nitrososphaerales archaeon]|jgi:DNA-directed RNA polymerase subunit RPC12/RpoP